MQAAVSGLPQYTYGKPIGGKKNITHPSLCKLIVREFFSIRELCRADGDGQPTPVSHLSSGEQRRALIDVAANHLRLAADQHQRTILAIDEPEISLHTSRCFDQFEDLFDVARTGIQTIVTTHWYGFLPIAHRGHAHFLRAGDGGRVAVDSYDLSRYKEEVKHKSRNSKGKLPFDLTLKSSNDLVQSVAASLSLERPYTWILCEGSSEVIYLSFMLRQYIEAKRVRVLPLGGVREVIRIYQHLEAALFHEVLSSAGQVVALVDTDEQMIRYVPQGGAKSLHCVRLLLPRAGKLKLVPVESTDVSPATAIEDVLNPECFVAALQAYEGHFSFRIDDVVAASPAASGQALDLRTSEKEDLAKFFSLPNMKVEFAEKYVEASIDGQKEPLFELLKKWLPELS